MMQPDFTILVGKDLKEGYSHLLELEAYNAEHNGLYLFFDEFLPLTKSDKSYVRVRGFRLCCMLAKWDSEGKINTSIDEMLLVLSDDKPIDIRQYILSLHQVILYKPELGDRIAGALDDMNLSKFKESMRPLIEKDILELKQIL